MAERQIVACGGFLLGSPLQEHVLSLARGRRALYVPTANMENADNVLKFYELMRGHGEADHLLFNPYPPDDVREFALSFDAIFVGGGNTANMLAVWRLHGFDAVLREAWESGIVLAGSSAGMICWFEAGVTDSFGLQLEGMPDGLGFLAGSACPHYDGEERRRPRYRELIDGGFPSGLAADDGAALHFVGTELREVLAVRDGATAYRVEPGCETALEARSL
ncbi:MAG TPA: peptidase E [Gaiellaceae bacterium]|nr:peptidase E [Gaiellaceae bacterium]